MDPIKEMPLLRAEKSSTSSEQNFEKSFSTHKLRELLNKKKYQMIIFGHEDVSFREMFKFLNLVTKVSIIEPSPMTKSWKNRVLQNVSYFQNNAKSRHGTLNS